MNATPGNSIPEERFKKKLEAKRAADSAREKARLEWAEAVEAKRAAAEAREAKLARTIVPEDVIAAKREARKRARDELAQRKWEQAYQAISAKEKEKERLDHAARLAEFKNELHAMNVSPIGLLRMLPTIFRENSGGFVRTVTLHCSEGAAGVKYFLEMAKLVGFETKRDAVSEEETIVTLRKAYSSRCF